jgi:hypothetical protein
MSELVKLHCRPVGGTSTRDKVTPSQLPSSWWSLRRGPGQGEHLSRAMPIWVYCALSSGSGRDQSLADSALPRARRQGEGGVGERQKPIRFAGPRACKWREVRQGPAGPPSKGLAGTCLPRRNQARAAKCLTVPSRGMKTTVKRANVA